MNSGDDRVSRCITDGSCVGSGSISVGVNVTLGTNVTINAFCFCNSFPIRGSRSCSCSDEVEGVTNTFRY